MDHVDPHQYTISIKRVVLNEGTFFEALVAELPDLVEYADTHQEAYALAVESIADLSVAAKEQARDFPAPLPSRTLIEHSGRVTLRMSKTLHIAASNLAERDGTSLNSWISEAIAARVGASNPNQTTTAIAAQRTMLLAISENWIKSSVQKNDFFNFPSETLSSIFFDSNRLYLSQKDTTINQSFLLLTN